MSKRTFIVDVHGVFKVAFDDALMPDDEWRESFYNINTLAQLAEHFVWNVGLKKRPAERLYGFCNTPLASEVRVVDEYQWDFTTEEVAGDD